MKQILRNAVTAHRDQSAALIRDQAALLAKFVATSATADAATGDLDADDLDFIHDTIRDLTESLTTLEAADANLLALYTKTLTEWGT